MNCNIYLWVNFYSNRRLNSARTQPQFINKRNGLNSLSSSLNSCKYTCRRFFLFIFSLCSELSQWIFSFISYPLYLFLLNRTHLNNVYIDFKINENSEALHIRNWNELKLSTNRENSWSFWLFWYVFHYQS